MCCEHVCLSAHSKLVETRPQDFVYILCRASTHSFLGLQCMTPELHCTDFLSIDIQQYQRIAYCGPLAQLRKRDEPWWLGPDTQVFLTGYQDISALQKHPPENGAHWQWEPTSSPRYFHHHAKYYM